MRQSLAFVRMAIPMLFMPLAHVGHWSMYVIYAVPVFVVLASVMKTVRQERRTARESADS